MKTNSSPNSSRLNRYALGVATVLLVVSSPGRADETDAAGRQFLRRVESVVLSLKETGYKHSTRIDAVAGVFYCDCSGFLGYFLQKEFPEAFAALRGEEAPWRSRPLAVTFYETFFRAGGEKVPGWSQVKTLALAKPGDFVAWRKARLEQGTTTGHVLIMASDPVREEDGRYRVRVIDSTRRLHADDTRAAGSNGVGSGTMWFAVDESGKPTQYYVDSSPKPGDSTQILIGRLSGGTAP